MQVLSLKSGLQQREALVKPRLWVDFNKTGAGELLLTCNGTWQDIAAMDLVLVDGMKVVFWDDDSDDAGNPDALEAEGVVWFNKELGEWVGEYDFSQVRHASDRLRSAPDGGMEAGTGPNASVRMALRRNEAMLAYYRQVYEARRRTMGADDPRTHEALRELERALEARSEAKDGA